MDVARWKAVGFWRGPPERGVVVMSDSAAADVCCVVRARMLSQLSDQPRFPNQFKILSWSCKASSHLPRHDTLHPFFNLQVCGLELLYTPLLCRRSSLSLDDYNEVNLLKKITLSRDRFLSGRRCRRTSAVRLRAVGRLSLGTGQSTRKAVARDGLR